MSKYQPAQIFASFSTSPPASPAKQKRVQMDEVSKRPAAVKDRLIEVSATGEVSLKPDRCLLRVNISNTKDNIEETKTSISRRVDYIIQTLHNHGVEESDIQEYKNTQRVESAYRVNVEITVQFSDLQKCQSVSNLLVEKLDESVKVGLAEFYHSTQSLENLRRQASLLAVHNAKQKAQEIARYVHQALGRPSVIREEDLREWEGTGDGEDPTVTSVQQQIANKTVTVSCKVFVSYELKQKIKSKHPDQS